MTRKNCILGLTLLALGVGLLLGLILPAGWFIVLLSLGLIAAGVLLLKKG